MKIRLTIDLTPEQRRALERALYPGESRLLDRADAARWIEEHVRWRLTALAVPPRALPVVVLEDQQ